MKSLIAIAAGALSFFTSAFLLWKCTSLDALEVATGSLLFYLFTAMWVLIRLEHVQLRRRPKRRRCKKAKSLVIVTLDPQGWNHAA